MQRVCESERDMTELNSSEALAKQRADKLCADLVIITRCDTPLWHLRIEPVLRSRSREHKKMAHLAARSAAINATVDLFHEYYLYKTKLQTTNFCLGRPLEVCSKF